LAQDALETLERFAARVRDSNTADFRQRSCLYRLRRRRTPDVILGTRAAQDPKSDHSQTLRKMSFDDDDRKSDNSSPEPLQSPTGSPRAKLSLPLHFARRHHKPIPEHDEEGYAEYLKQRDQVLRMAVEHLERGLAKRSPVERIDLQGTTLTLRLHNGRQSKLSQQELAELQKSTHFDKKELQQWYKGVFLNSLIHSKQIKKSAARCGCGAALEAWESGSLTLLSTKQAS
jgi:hypothetical protein